MASRAPALRTLAVLPTADILTKTRTKRTVSQQNVTFLPCPLFRVTRMAHACNMAHAHYKSVSVTRKLFTELKILFLFTCLLYFRNTITNVYSLKYTGFVQNYFCKEMLITRTLIGYAVAWCNISVSNRGRQRPFFFKFPTDLII